VLQVGGNALFLEALFADECVGWTGSLGAAQDGGGMSRFQIGCFIIFCDNIFIKDSIMRLLIKGFC
jgi:hypothetical protein